MKEVSEHCTGERFIAKIPEYGGQPQFSRYEECNVKAKCRRYMSPVIRYLDRRKMMLMPAFKPCPYYEEWQP